MKTRVFGALLGAAIFIPLLVAGGTWFVAGIFTIGLIGLYEVGRMQRVQLPLMMAIIALLGLYAVLIPDRYYLLTGWITAPHLLHLVVVSFLIGTVYYHDRINFEDVAVVMFGALYIGKGFNALITIREESLLLVSFLFVAIWATDIGAYMIGRRFGQHALSPKVSPNKTIEGAVGGVFSALVFTSVLVFFYPELKTMVPFFPVAAVLLSMFGQLGDLVESAMKRYYQVKDSGTLIPGHGGILDRFDSTLFASFILIIWQNLLI